MIKLFPIIVVAVTVLFTGCVTVTPPTPPEQTTALPSAVPGEDIEGAMRNGEYSKAVELFAKRAAGLSGTVQSHARLRWIAALARDDQLTQAKHQLNQLLIPPQDKLGQSLLRLANAHIAVAERRPNQIQLILNEPLPSDLAATYHAEFHGLRAEAYVMLGNQLESARERVARERYLALPNEIKTNQQQIWSNLASLSDRALQQLRTAPPPDVLSGWMELVAIAKIYQLSPVRLQEQLAVWQRKYYNHPINTDILNGLLQRKVEDVAYPDRLALLLPLSGKFAKAGEALRDGFLAAYYTRRPNAKQNIRIYDIGDDKNTVNHLYQQAVRDGAQFIVGPLEKDAVQQLLQLEELSVPTLTLNYLPDEDKSQRNNLYQFGLSPEDEARQVADRTWLDGHVNAAALVPSGLWGERLLNAFKERWTSLGGNLLEVQTYDPSKTDFSDSIQTLLNIDESQRRYRRIATTVKRDVKFTPRRRMDIDFIFVAAYPVQGRQIQPQLNFYHAGDVPVYSTSHIYTGTLNQERDRDIDGVHFADMPWVLSGGGLHRNLKMEIEPYISDAGSTMQRLFALGIDAFSVIGALHTLRNFPYERFDGETGSLSLDNTLRIRRQLTWVKFRAGRPTLLEHSTN